MCKKIFYLIWVSLNAVSNYKSGTNGKFETTLKFIGIIQVETEYETKNYLEQFGK